MTFTQTQIDALAAPLDRSHVAQRKQGGGNVSYIEAWHAIAEANRIFGFDNWNRETVELRQIGGDNIGTDKYGKEQWRVNYMARVRITVAGVVREGSGFGQGIDKDIGQAHESALKEAETDAMKRALMTFGNPFGLALYDKTQANVCEAPEAPPQSVVMFMEGLRKAFNEGGAAVTEYWTKHWAATDKEWRPYLIAEKDKLKAGHDLVDVARAA